MALQKPDGTTLFLLLLVNEQVSQKNIPSLPLPSREEPDEVSGHLAELVVPLGDDPGGLRGLALHHVHHLERVRDVERRVNQGKQRGGGHHANTGPGRVGWVCSSVSFLMTDPQTR